LTIAAGGQAAELANWARQAYDSEYRESAEAPGALPRLDMQARRNLLSGLWKNSEVVRCECGLVQFPTKDRKCRTAILPFAHSRSHWLTYLSGAHRETL